MIRCLKVFVKGKVVVVFVFVFFSRFFKFFGVVYDIGFLVFVDMFFEEVGFVVEGDVFYEVEGVGGVVDFVVVEGDKEMVSDEFDVLFYEV